METEEELTRDQWTAKYRALIAGASVLDAVIDLQQDLVTKLLKSRDSVTLGEASALIDVIGLQHDLVRKLLEKRANVLKNAASAAVKMTNLK